MAAISLVVGLLAAGASAFTVAPTTHTRRQIIRLAAGTGAASFVLPFAPAFADTQAELDKPQVGFDTDEAKRADFLKKQKAYKKAWRKELSNLEFSSNDKEAVDAMEALYKLIKENGYEVPEGIRKQDLDQVYKRIKDSLGKDSRMEFIKLDKLVRDITTVKRMGTDELGY